MRETIVHKPNFKELITDFQCLSVSDIDIMYAEIRNPENLGLRAMAQFEKDFSRFLYNQWFNAPDKIAKTQHGKPTAPYPYYVSNSHSGNFFLWARAQHNLGIDMQVFTDKCLRVSSKFINETEWLLKPEQWNKEDFATLIWTIKEAAYKCFGKHIPLKAIGVKSLDFQEERGQLVLAHNQEVFTIEFRKTGSAFISGVYP